MRFGAHVSSAGGLLPAIDRGDAISAEVIQVHTQSPRTWKPNAYSHELLATFAAQVEAHPRISATVCHASYLINLGSADDELLAKSQVCLEKNLEVATEMGSVGLVLHLGSHLGEGFDPVVAPVAGRLVTALDRVADELGRVTCPILMENTAGAGGTIGRSFEELARVLEAAGGDERLGVCLDTQHLFASGVAYESLDEAEAVVAGLDRAIGLERLGCLHVNDSKVPFDSNRDRHENLGDGFIGRRALGSLLAHPALDDLPAVLEVPGDERSGPGLDDLAAARAIYAAGRRRWRARERAGGAATPPPRRGPRREPGGRRGSPRGRRP